MGCCPEAHDLAIVEVAGRVALHSKGQAYLCWPWMLQVRVSVRMTEVAAAAQRVECLHSLSRTVARRAC